MQLRHHYNKVLFFLFLLVGIFAHASTWEPPLTVSSGGGSSADVKIVCDGEGNAAIIWAQFVGADNLVHTSYRPVGGLWETPTVMDTAIIASFDLCVDEAGNLTAVWSTFPLGDIRTRFRPLGGGWGPIVIPFSPGGANITVDVRVDCVSNNTYAIITWVNTTATALAQSVFRNGMTYSVVSTINNTAPHTADAASKPIPKLLPNGTARVVWRGTAAIGPIVDIFQSTSSLGGTWGQPPTSLGFNAAMGGDPGVLAKKRLIYQRGLYP